MKVLRFKHLHFLSHSLTLEIIAMCFYIQKIQLSICVINISKLICNCQVKGYTGLEKEIESSRLGKELGPCGPTELTINMMMEVEVSKDTVCTHLPLFRLQSQENS